MATKIPTYAGNLFPGTYRGPSNPIWYDFPVADLMEQPSDGFQFFDDFIMSGNLLASSAFQGSWGKWSVYADAATTFTDGQLEGGVVQMQNTTTARGATIIASDGSFRLVTTSTLALNQKLWFEASVAVSTVVATKQEQFVGLAIPALNAGLTRANYPITTTPDTLDATNGTFIGFHRKSTAAPTDWQFCFNLAGGTVNYVQNLTTLLASAQTVQSTVPFGIATPATISPLVANQFVKLGFKFDPNAVTKVVPTLNTARQTVGVKRRKLITVFVNGIELSTFLSTDDVQNATAAQAFPTGFMAPCYAFSNQTSSTPGSSQLDFIRVGQMANS